MKFFEEKKGPASDDGSDSNEYLQNFSFSPFVL